MNKDLGSLYVAIVENRVIEFDTNLKKFHEKVSKAEPLCRNYDYLYREMKKSDTVKFIGAGDKVYILQKVM